LAERYGARLEHAQGIPPELIQKSVTMGVALERPNLFNLYELMGEVEEAIRGATAQRIRLLGSDGRA
jgi:hypothetical protein